MGWHLAVRCYGNAILLLNISAMRDQVPLKEIPLQFQNTALGHTKDYHFDFHKKPAEQQIIGNIYKNKKNRHHIAQINFVSIINDFLNKKNLLETITICKNR